jgi:hypothetical protein
MGTVFTPELVSSLLPLLKAVNTYLINREQRCEFEIHGLESS